MAGFKEQFTECPICTECFDEGSRIPRRMPCCVQSICQLCLCIYSKGNGTIACPICRQKISIRNGVETLPKERLILKIIDHLKLQQGHQLQCTECPDSNSAIAACSNCGLYLCNDCLTAHTRNAITKRHKTVSLEEMKTRPVESMTQLHVCPEHHQPLQFFCCTCKKVICVSCTVVEHKEGQGHDVVSIQEAHKNLVQESEELLCDLDIKRNSIKEIVERLQEENGEFERTMENSLNQINAAFDKVFGMLQRRRQKVIEEFEDGHKKQQGETKKALESNKAILKRITMATDYTQELKRKADKIEGVELMSSSNTTLRELIVESETVPSSPRQRQGISFTPLSMQHLAGIIITTGLVKSVTFSPSCETDDGTEIRDVVGIEIPKLQTGIGDFTSKELVVVKSAASAEGDTQSVSILCPHLELDSSTSCKEVTFLSQVCVSNKRPDEYPPETGCRLEEWRRVLSSTPVVIQNGQHVLLQLRLDCTIKVKRQEQLVAFELALTDKPMDHKARQTKGLSITVETIPQNKQLLLFTEYGGREISDKSLGKVKAGTSHDIIVTLLLDGCQNLIHVFDEEEHVATVEDAEFSRPLWLMLYVGVTKKSETRCRLLSGQQLVLTKKLLNLLASKLF